MSKYGDLIKEARKTEKQSETVKSQNNSGKQEKKLSIILENSHIPISTKKEEEKLAGISIKVAESLRRHWVVESKKTGKSMTSVIINALTKEFGEP